MNNRYEREDKMDRDEIEEIADTLGYNKFGDYIVEPQEIEEARNGTLDQDTALMVSVILHDDFPEESARIVENYDFFDAAPVHVNNMP